MRDVLRAAVQMHQAGKLGPAAALYQTVLDNERDNPEALHLLGVLHHQQGDHARAIELIVRAVALKPNVAEFHANLAEAYRARGQFDRAAGSCQAALSLRPDFPEAAANLGLALQGLGRSREAADQFRHALRLRPDFALVHNNLGKLLRESGRMSEALTHFERAVELDPTDALAHTNLGQILLESGRASAALHHNLGNVLRELQRFDEAKAAHGEALRLDPNLAKAHAFLGLCLRREGQFGEAAARFQHAIELDPADSTFPEFLGDLHLELQEFAEAIVCYERALTLASSERPLLHLSLGWALQETGRLEQAGEHFRTALKLQPRSPIVQNYLGGYHEERGEIAEAEAAYRRALQLQPSFSLPLARLGLLLRDKLPDADRVDLETRLADPNLGPEPRGRLGFALAHVLDGRHEFKRAAAWLRKANRVTLETRRGRNEFVAADHERFVDNFLRRFNEGFFARTAGMGHDSRRPVFVFGLPRSGTTLIEQILASHSLVHGAGELLLARQAFESMPSVMNRTAHPMECIIDLDRESIHRLAEGYLEKLQSLAGPKAERVTDKMPDNYMYLGFLATLFPNAAFIHCKRDLRDVALSCWMTDFRSMTWPCEEANIAFRFRQYLRLMDHWRSVLPVPIHEISYEETVADLEGTARKLVTACGLNWEPACLSFHRTQRTIRTASLIQVRKPVYTTSVGRWKNYETELAGLFASLPSG
jgi:tetratricopeptide (TPR) repeat protein